MSYREKLEGSIDRIATAFADGLDVGDVSVLVKEAIEVAETFTELHDEQKRSLATAFFGLLVDKFFGSTTGLVDDLVERIDWPWIPAWVRRLVVDPLAKRIAAAIIPTVLKAVAPKLFDLVVAASLGKVEVNQGEP